MIGSNINSDELSFYQNFKSEYCVANPYNCKSDGSVVSYSVNDFLKTLYREVDNTFHVYGYTAVQFEYCESHRKNNCYRVIDDEDYDLKYRRTNDNYVKKGTYKITKQY